MSAKKPGTEVEEPRIELYMYSLNQEFPREKGHTHFLKNMSELKADVSGKLAQIDQVEGQVFKLRVPDDWSVQWISNEWIENHTKAVGVGIREEFDPMLRARLREEDFGGILFEPTSDRVFRLNQPGYKLFSELREYYSSGNKDLSKFKSRSADPESVRRFVAYLEGAGLWLREST